MESAIREDLATVRRVRPKISLPGLLRWQREAQEKFNRPEVRTLVLQCGRQAGKSRYAVSEALAHALRGGRVWWIAPTYLMAETVGWSTLMKIVRKPDGTKMPGAEVIRGKRMVRFGRRGFIQVRTGNNPDRLRGATLDLVVLDEASYMPQEVWNAALRPTLARYGGKAILATTPNGLDWVNDIYTAGIAGDPEVACMRVKTERNPYISKSEIEAARKRLPTELFREEWEGVPRGKDSGIISLQRVQEAQQRHNQANQRGEFVTGRPHVLAVDVSEGGRDRTIIAERRGWHIVRLHDATPDNADDMLSIADKVEELADSDTSIVVDAIGSGAMLPSILRSRGHTVISYKGSEKTPLRDSSGEFGFSNIRSASYWHLRELLATDGPGITLPPSSMLARELIEPKYARRTGAKIQLESKDQLKRAGRLGRSPDLADAVVMAFWIDRSMIR